MPGQGQGQEGNNVIRESQVIPNNFQVEQANDDNENIVQMAQENREEEYRDVPNNQNVPNNPNPQNNQNVPDPSAIFNRKGKLKVPDALMAAIQRLAIDGESLAKPYYDIAVQMGRKESEGLDNREVSTFAWYMAENPEKYMEDPTYMEALKMPTLSQDAQEDILDQFYAAKRNVDFRKYDYSCLTGNDKTERKKGELSKSEKDFLKLVGGIQTNQDNTTKAKEKPEYYLGLLDRLTPEERYRMEINNDYEANAIEPIRFWIQTKGGYNPQWRYLPAQRKEAYDLAVQSADEAFLYSVQKFQVFHTLYNYRMAKLENSPNPPKPELNIKIDSRTGIMDIIEAARKVRSGEEFDKYDDSPNRAMSMINGLVPFYNSTMDRPIGGDNDRHSNTFIDGVPAYEFFKDYLKPEMKPGVKQTNCDILVAEAILSGKHHVEFGLRYMNSDHNMDVEYFSVKPDLTAVAEAQRKQHNWFRRTFFDWGPFKIPTVLDEQKKLMAGENDAKRAERIAKIKKADPNRKATIDNPKQVLTKRGMIEFEAKRYEMQKLKKYSFGDWIAKKNQVDPLNQDNIAKLNNNVVNFFGADHNWTAKSAVKYCISEFGVINTTRLFQKLAKENPESAFINADKEMMNRISKVQNGADAATLTDEQVFYKTMDHLLKNGALENENSEMMIHMMKELELSEEQRKFVDTLDFLSSQTKEGENLIHQMAEKQEKNPDEEVPEKDSKTIQKYIATKSLNKVFIDTIKEGLKKKDATFDGEYLKTAACKNLMEICTEKQGFYQGILDKVVENTVQVVKGVTVENTLRQVFMDRDKIEGNTKEAIDKALHPKENEQKEIKEVKEIDAAQVQNKEDEIKAGNVIPKEGDPSEVKNNPEEKAENQKSEEKAEEKPEEKKVEVVASMKM